MHHELLLFVGACMQKLVIFENAAIPQQLLQDSDNVHCVITTTVLPSNETLAQVAQHPLNVGLGHAVKGSKQLSHINPLVGVTREINFGQHTLRVEAVSNIPDTERREGWG